MQYKVNYLILTRQAKLGLATVCYRTPFFVAQETEFNSKKRNKGNKKTSQLVYSAEMNDEKKTQRRIFTRNNSHFLLLCCVQR